MGSVGVVASVVPVDDPATVPLMLALHEQLRAGLGLPEAVHRARHAVGPGPLEQYSITVQRHHLKESVPTMTWLTINTRFIRRAASGWLKMIWLKGDLRIRDAKCGPARRGRPRNDSRTSARSRMACAWQGFGLEATKRNSPDETAAVAAW